MKVMRRRLNGVYRADGFSGPTRRYVLVVSLLAGLASLPTLAAITAGSDALDSEDDTSLTAPPFLPEPSRGPVVVPTAPPTTATDPPNRPRPTGGSTTGRRSGDKSEQAQPPRKPTRTTTHHRNRTENGRTAYGSGSARRGTPGGGAAPAGGAAPGSPGGPGGSGRPGTPGGSAGSGAPGDSAGPGAPDRPGPGGPGQPGAPAKPGRPPCPPERRHCEARPPKPRPIECYERPQRDREPGGKNEWHDWAAERRHRNPSQVPAWHRPSGRTGPGTDDHRTPDQGRWGNRGADHDRPDHDRRSGDGRMRGGGSMRWQQANGTGDRAARQWSRAEHRFDRGGRTAESRHADRHHRAEPRHDGGRAHEFHNGGTGEREPENWRGKHRKPGFLVAGRHAR